MMLYFVGFRVSPARESEDTMKDTFDVIIAGYQSVEPAQKNFDTLVKLINGKQVRSEGVILVQQDADGKVSVTQTGDHMGRKGMGWGGGVGLVVGLFSPPLLASIIVGAAAGGLVGKFAQHKVNSGIETGLGDKLKPGTAAIIAIVHRRRRQQAGCRAGARRLTCQVGCPDGQGRPQRPEGRTGRSCPQVQP
jgi:uncharacterized membrane protein